MSGLPGALWRFRIMSWVTGVALILLFFVAIPAGAKTLGTIVGDAHGWFFFPLYLITTIDLLWRRVRWPWWQVGLVGLAGFVPLASFVAERVVTKRLTAEPASLEA